MRLFMAVPMTISAAVANFGGLDRLRYPWPTSSTVADIGGLSRLRRPEISPFWFELNGTFRALDTSLSSYGGVLVLAMRFAVLQKEQASVVNTVYRR